MVPFYLHLLRFSAQYIRGSQERASDGLFWCTCSAKLGHLALKFCMNLIWLGVFFLLASGNIANLSNKFCVIGWVKFKTSLPVYIEMFECCHDLDSGGKSESPEMLYGLFNKPTERQCGGVFSGSAKLYQDLPQTYSAPNDTSVNETPFCTLLLYALLFSLLPLQVSFLHLTFHIILKLLNLQVHFVPGHACVCTQSSTGGGDTRKLVCKPSRCAQSRRNSLNRVSAPV